MGLLCKRYDMIALLLQAAPKVHHNLPKAIITLNSPEAIIAGDLLCGRCANISLRHKKADVQSDVCFFVPKREPYKNTALPCNARVRI